MTIHQLEQYADLRREIKRLEHRIADMQAEAGRHVTDAVRGSSPQFPYTQHTVRIEGLDQRYLTRLGEAVTLLSRRKGDLMEAFLELEAWLETVPDSKVRQLIELKYVDGKSWHTAARKVYGYPCGDAARMRVKRFLTK